MGAYELYFIWPWDNVFLLILPHVGVSKFGLIVGSSAVSLSTCSSSTSSSSTSICSCDISLESALELESFDVSFTSSLSFSVTYSESSSSSSWFDFCFTVHYQLQPIQPPFICLMEDDIAKSYAPSGESKKIGIPSSMNCICRPEQYIW